MSRRAEERGSPGADERWRCFVAIDLGEPVRTAIASYLAELRATVAGIAWTRPENLHLTLAFLGDVPAARIAPLVERLTDGLRGAPPLAVRAVGVGAFPSLARPQVLWIGIESPDLGAVADAVQSACMAEGLPRDAKPFRPHVTLGRVRARNRRATPDLMRLARDGGREFGRTPVDRVVLYRSRLDASGARHTPLATFPLAPADLV